MYQKMEERLDVLETEITKIKEQKENLDEMNKRFQQHLERMEQQLRKHEKALGIDSPEPNQVSQGALLGAFGIMPPPKKGVFYYEFQEKDDCTKGL
ncbi:MAG: hypothetical protein ACRCXC_13075 [Legionella sp.]